MSIEKEFVPYNESLELKELGFNESCFGYYYTLNGKDWKFAEKSEYQRLDDELMFGPQSVLLTPTFSQAFRFFREKYKIHYSIDYECSQHDYKWGYNWSIYNYNRVVKTEDEYITSHPNAPVGEWMYEKPEEAELACLRKLIEICRKLK